MFNIANWENTDGNAEIITQYICCFVYLFVWEFNSILCVIRLITSFTVV